MERKIEVGEIIVHDEPDGRATHMDRVAQAGMVNAGGYYRLAELSDCKTEDQAKLFEGRWVEFDGERDWKINGTRASMVNPGVMLWNAIDSEGNVASCPAFRFTLLPLSYKPEDASNAPRDPVCDCGKREGEAHAKNCAYMAGLIRQGYWFCECGCCWGPKDEMPQCLNCGRKRPPKPDAATDFDHGPGCFKTTHDHSKQYQEFLRKKIEEAEDRGKEVSKAINELVLAKICGEFEDGSTFTGEGQAKLEWGDDEWGDDEPIRLGSVEPGKDGKPGPNGEPGGKGGQIYFGLKPNIVKCEDCGKPIPESECAEFVSQGNWEDKIWKGCMDCLGKRMGVKRKVPKDVAARRERREWIESLTARPEPKKKEL